MMAEGVMAKHGAVEHWAKIEVPSRAADLENVRERLAARYPLERFAAVRWVELGLTFGLGYGLG